jgi:hypothetical protein
MLVLCLGLMLVQFIAAVPWLLAWTWQPKHPDKSPKKTPSARLTPLTALGGALGIALGGGLFLGWFLDGVQTSATLDGYGKVFGSTLQLQLHIDLLVIIFAVMTWLWPKGAAVARAAFREGYRQPMFWLLFGLSFLFIFLSIFVPYFTFGEDYIMVKELGFDTIMLAAAAFGVLAAALSISEEIEGRTAITLMSKPVSRRQFLLGKFAGIFLCCLLLVSALGWLFDHCLLYKRWLDKMPPIAVPPQLMAWLDAQSLSPSGRELSRGALTWLVHTSEVLPGLVLASSLVMVMVAVAVSLATRLPLIVNLVSCMVVYVLANLSPILVISTRPDDPARAGPVQKLLHFTSQAFDTVLPGLELFRVRPTLVDESTLPMGQYLQHVAAVSIYGAMFTAIVLLVGLVLFEDRDLA